MSEKTWSKYSLIIIFLTSLLTFFILGVTLSDKVEEYYVKNIIKTDNNSSKVQDNFFNKDRNDLDLERFWAVYDILKSDYYWVDGLSKEELVDWAIAWLIESIWDKHSEFMTADVTKKFNDALTGDFEWIWAVVKKIPLGIEVERIIKGSPAEKYWVFAKDIILKANWEELIELDLYDALEKIKWPTWTKVALSIIRQGEVDLLEIELTRAKIKIPSVSSEIFEEENIWYIELNMFWQNTSADFEKALNSLSKTNGLIIDLRNNWWGYLQSAVDILWNFIPEWEILVKTKYRDSFFDVVYRSVKFWEKYDKKIVVLINWSSASASEITAWALRDYNKAIIIK